MVKGLIGRQLLHHPFNWVFLWIGVMGASGCGSKPIPIPQPTATVKTYAGQEFTVACADPNMVKNLAGPVAGWAGRTEAKVKFVTQSPSEVADADILVIRPCELGAWAAPQHLVPVPESVLLPTQPLDYPRMDARYRSLAKWAGVPVAIPLSGDGHVLVYRADLFENEANRRAFEQQQNRPLQPPRTWEDLLDSAAFFTKLRKQPALISMKNSERLLLQFHQIAACYNRSAALESNKPHDAANPQAELGFQIRTDSWSPRLDAPGFTAAADWLAQSAPYRMAEVMDPVASLAQGSAVVAVLALEEVGRLPKTKNGQVENRFRVIGLPSTQSYFAPDGNRVAVGGDGNFISYLGSSGWVAVVKKTCRNQSAAWELLVELATPAALLARISDPQVGAGPIRGDHANPSSTQIWLRYGFDEIGTQQLAAAIAKLTRIEGRAATPAYALRTPDQEARMKVLADCLSKAATGAMPGAEAMKQAQAAWVEMDAKADVEALRHWRRNALNLP